MAENWDTLSGAAHGFLGPTYEMVKVFLEDIVQRWPLDELDNRVELTDVNFSEDWQDFAAHYHGYLVVIAVSVTLLLTLIIGGCLFCCCRCCPCCAKCHCCGCCCCCPNPSTRRHNSGKISTAQLCCVLLLFLLMGAMSMGIAIMFVSNPVLDSEVKDRTLYHNLDETVRDAQTFIDDTMMEISETSLEIYTSVQDTIHQALDNIPATSMDALEAATGSLHLLAEQRQLFQTISNSCVQIDNTLYQLEEDALFLESELDELQSAISELFPDCAGIPKCNDSLQALVVTVDYTTLSNFSDVSQAAGQAEQSVQGTEQEVINIEDDIEKQLDDAIEEVKKALDAGYEGLSNFMDNATEKTDLGLVDKVEELEENDAREVFETYWDVWFICMVCLSVSLSLIVVVLLVGLGCGLCGKKPPDSGMCARSKAPCLLMASVYLLLFFSVLVVAVSLVLFLVGGALHTEACRYFEQPVPYKPSLDTIDKLIVSNTDVTVYVIDAINTCGDGYTLYSALGLDGLDDINLNETLDPDSYNIPDALHDLDNVDVTIGVVTLVTSSTLAYASIVNETLRVKDYELYDDVMTSDVTEGDLEDIADSLEQYANRSSNETEYRARTERLRMLRAHVTVMENRQGTLLHEVHHMQNMSINGSVDQQLQELKAAEETLSLEGDDIVKEVVSNVTSVAEAAIYTAAEDIANAIRYEVGDCGPLHDTAYGFLSYVCVDVLYPLNAFWFGMGWFLTFALVTMFTACTLAHAFTPVNVVANGYFRTRSKRASTYAPSDDLYMNCDSKTLNLPEAGFQPREYMDYYQHPVLVSYVGKTEQDEVINKPYSNTMETDLSDYNDKEYETFPKPFYC